MNIETLSLIFTFLALVFAIVPIVIKCKQDKLKKITQLKKTLLESNWTNEGDIRPLTKTNVFLNLSDYPGYNKVSGLLEIGTIERSFNLYGEIKSNGTISCVINGTIGWREYPVYIINLNYKYSTDQLTLIPLKYHKKFNKNSHYDQKDYEQFLKENIIIWRAV